MRQAMMAVGAVVLMAGGVARGIERSADVAAGAVDLKLADDAQNGEGRFSGLEYEKSDRFGRAWLVLHYRFQAPCRDSDGECELDAPLRVSVPGLSYDPAGKRVVYERVGAEPVVCATVRKSGFPTFAESFAETGKCTTRLVKVDRDVDDGFAGQRDRREEVHFGIAAR